MEAGIRCVIAPSFGAIFHDNAYQNGLLPIRLELPLIERIAQAPAWSNRSEMMIDLQRSALEVPGLEPIGFSLAADRREAMLEGLDQLSLIMRDLTAIETFEQQAALSQPWLYK
jgi:3-isopropylmalate/(R)-2-methylmalate dehydratase small subunit